MKRNALLFGMILLLALTVFTSCRKKQNLQVTKALITISFAGGNDFFRVEADCDWTVEIESGINWLHTTPNSGSGDASVSVVVDRNQSSNARNASIYVSSSNGKIRREVVVAQNKIDIDAITYKIWFLRTYERWDTDYYNEVIPESYRDWTYYTNEEFENWYFYFVEENQGFEIRTKQGDTIYYPCQYYYYPENDSINIVFQTTADTIEDYHATIHQLDNTAFTFSDPYRPHQYEKLNLLNASIERAMLKVNPKKIGIKPKGALISID